MATREHLRAIEIACEQCDCFVERRRSFVVEWCWNHDLLLMSIDDAPDILWLDRHVDMRHTKRRERIDDRIDDRRRCANRPCFTHALDAQRVYGRRRFC